MVCPRYFASLFTGDIPIDKTQPDDLRDIHESAKTSDMFNKAYVVC